MLKNQEVMLRKSFLSGLVPLSRAFHSTRLNREHKGFGIIGVPFAKGQRRTGVDLGPSAIRSGGLISNLKEIAGTEKYSILGFLGISYVPLLL